MTNGEKFREIFSISQVDEGVSDVYVWTPNHDAAEISIDWWNAEYKEPVIRDNGVKNELNRVKNELDPTTKNEAKYCDRNICLKNEYNNVGCEDCEVTKSQEPTTKNDLGVDAVSRQEVLDLIADYDLSMGQVVRGIHALPSVTPQLSSGLEKNSKKLEKDFGELDCISRTDVLKLMKDNWHTHNGDWAMQESMDDIRALPSVISQEPKTGHWEWLTEDKYRCSNCNHETRVDECMNKPIYDFCPFCGKRLAESEDNNE